MSGPSAGISPRTSNMWAAWTALAACRCTPPGTAGDGEAVCPGGGLASCFVYSGGECAEGRGPAPNQGLGLGMAPIRGAGDGGGSELTVNVSATVTLASGYEIGQVQQPIEDAIEAYLLTVRQAWDTNTSTTSVVYEANVYLARITAAIVGVTGVVNATNVQLNGGTADLILTESGATPAGARDGDGESKCRNLIMRC